MREEFDPSTIEDEGLRQVFLYLMNVVENLSAKVAELTEENQRLRDENNRLKGEQGKPRILPNKGRGDLSSEKERRESRPHHKERKQAGSHPDRSGSGSDGGSGASACRCSVQRVHGRGCTGHRVSHRHDPVSEREILLAEPKADVCGRVESLLPRAVWAGGESLGALTLLCRADE